MALLVSGSGAFGTGCLGSWRRFWLRTPKPRRRDPGARMAVRKWRFWYRISGFWAPALAAVCRKIFCASGGRGAHQFGEKPQIPAQKLNRNTVSRKKPCECTYVRSKHTVGHRGGGRGPHLWQILSILAQKKPKIPPKFLKFFWEKWPNLKAKPVTRSRPQKRGPRSPGSAAKRPQKRGPKSPRSTAKRPQARPKKPRTHRKPKTRNERTTDDERDAENTQREDHGRRTKRRKHATRGPRTTNETPKTRSERTTDDERDAENTQREDHGRRTRRRKHARPFSFAFLAVFPCIFGRSPLRLWPFFLAFLAVFPCVFGRFPLRLWPFSLAFLAVVLCVSGRFPLRFWPFLFAFLAASPGY